MTDLRRDVRHRDSYSIKPAVGRQRVPAMPFLVMYVVMAFWTVGGAVCRVLIMFTKDQPLDALPFVGMVLGAVAVLVLIMSEKVWG